MYIDAKSLPTRFSNLSHAKFIGHVTTFVVIVTFHINSMTKISAQTVFHYYITELTVRVITLGDNSW